MFRSADQLRDLADSIDALPSGMITVDAHCRVVHANKAAEALFTRADGLIVRAGQLRAVQSFADHSLARGLAAAAGATSNGVDPWAQPDSEPGLVS